MLEISCKQLGKKVAIILGDIADTRTRWMVDILLITTDWIDLCRRPSLFIIRLAMLNMPAHSSLAADIGLYRSVEKPVSEGAMYALSSLHSNIL